MAQITLKVSKRQAAILHAAVFCAMQDDMDNEVAFDDMKAILDQIEEKYPAFTEVHASEWIWNDITPDQFDNH